MGTHSRIRELAGAILCGVVAVAAVATSGRCDDKPKADCPHCCEGRDCAKNDASVHEIPILSRIPYLNRLFKNVRVENDVVFERVGVDFDFDFHTTNQAGVAPVAGVKVGDDATQGRAIAAPKFSFTVRPDCPADTVTAVTAQMPATAPLCDRCPGAAMSTKAVAVGIGQRLRVPALECTECQGAAATSHAATVGIGRRLRLPTPECTECPGCVSDGACCEIELVTNDKLLESGFLLDGQSDIEFIGVEPEMPDLAVLVDGARAMGRAEVLERLVEKLEEHHAASMELAVKNARLAGTIEQLEEKAKYTQSMYLMAKEHELLSMKYAELEAVREGRADQKVAKSAAGAGDEDVGKRKSKAVAGGKLARKSSAAASDRTFMELMAQNRELMEEVVRLRDRVSQLENDRVPAAEVADRATRRQSETRR